MYETKGSPIGWEKKRRNVEKLKTNSADLIDFLPTGAHSGPRPSNADLAQLQIRVKHGILKISLYVCNNMNFRKMQI